MEATRNARLVLIGLLAAATLVDRVRDHPARSAPQSPPAPVYPPGHEYTLDELIDLSVHRNASLDVCRSLAESAQGLVDQVKALWLPVLNYTFAATTYNNDFNYRCGPCTW